MGTVEKIEKETGYWVLSRWEELHPQEEAVGYFIAKVYVLELDMEQLQKELPAVGHLLGTVGFALYQIDHTQDLSGVLDQPALAHHLVDTQRVHSCYSHLCDHVGTFDQMHDGHTISTKFYNKVVSQLEAGHLWRPPGALCT